MTPVSRQTFPGGPEMRRALRERTWLAARICYGETRAITTQATITQLSKTGARLKITTHDYLPSEFDVYIFRHNVSRGAKLIWRKQDSVGIQFVVAKEPVAAGPDHRETIKKLQAENARLGFQAAELLLRIQRLTEL
jgi:hypothetical protein